MTRVQSILVRARDALADQDNQKWSDEQLLRLLDEGQKDLCRRAKLLRSSVSFNVKRGQRKFYMPEDFLLLDSAYYEDKPLSLKGHYEIEKANFKWTEKLGTPHAIVYDKQNRGELILYPAPEDTGYFVFRPQPVWVTDSRTRLANEFGVVSNVPAGSALHQDYGIVSHVEGEWHYLGEGEEPRVEPKEYRLTSDFGVVTNAQMKLESRIVGHNVGIITGIEGCSVRQVVGLVTDVKVKNSSIVTYKNSFGTVSDIDIYQANGYISMLLDEGNVTQIAEALSVENGVITDLTDLENAEVEFNSDYGIPTAAYANAAVLKVFYIKIPTTVEEITDKLEVDQSMDEALKFYVAGSALLHNIDAQNRRLGENMLARYAELAKIAAREDSQDFTRTERVWYSSYNNGFNLGK